jgi:exosome complex component RRP42
MTTTTIVPCFSPGELSFVRGGVVCDLRYDGRNRLDYRPFSLDLGIIAQANGSARVRLGGTDVVVGVRAEIVAPAPEAPGVGSLSVSIDSSRGASDHAFLEDVLLHSITSGFSLASLCLVQGRYVWSLALDVVVIDNCGNLADVIFLAALSALRDARLPRVVPLGDVLDISDDPRNSHPLLVDGVPLCVTIGVVSGDLFVDPSLAEEAASSALFMVMVDREGAVCGSHKCTGSGSFHSGLLMTAVQTARKTVRSLFDTIDSLDLACRDNEGTRAKGFLRPDEFLRK